nr:hypothetical protein [Tanacetum cinerariifolium]
MEVVTPILILVWNEALQIDSLKILIVGHKRKTRWSNMVRRHWRTITGISLVEIYCGGLRYKFLEAITIIVAIGGWIISVRMSTSTCNTTLLNCFHRSRRLIFLVRNNALTISFNSATSGDMPEELQGSSDLVEIMDMSIWVLFIVSEELLVLDKMKTLGIAKVENVGKGERARTWLEKEPPNSITTWNDLVSKFVNCFFPSSKTTNLQNEIIRFNKYSIDNFYNSLNQSEQDSLNSAAGVASTSGSSTQDAHVTAITRKVKALISSFNQPVNSAQKGCEMYGGPHPYYECQAAGGYTQDGALPSDTVPNPKGEIKAITTRSGIVLDGPSIPPPLPFSFSKELERDPKTLNKELQDKSDIQIRKFLQIFKKLQFNISLVEALALMPKYHKMLKDILFDKEKLLGLVNTSLNENCSTVLLKKLPKKLRDLGKFLIPCDFHGLESCMALASLCGSINLIPLSMWKKLSLLDLTPTRMTLKLATRSISYPASIAEYVCMQVGKFTILAGFVVFDYDIDPYVPLILGRPFLRTTRALVDVHGEELILRHSDEKSIFHADSSSKHPHKHGNESINMINFTNITCEDRFPEVLKFTKSNHPFSRSTTSPSDSSPSLTPFETSDSLLEEFRNYFLNKDPSIESSPKFDVDITDPILESFTDKPTLIYSPLSRDDDDDNDDLFELKSDNDEWEMLLYGDSYKDIDSKKVKNKDSKMELLIDEANIVESNVLLPQLLNSDSTLPEESFEIATLSLSPFRNKDKVFNPGIHILGGTQIFNDETKDKDLIIKDHNFLHILSDQGLLFHLEVTVIET